MILRKRFCENVDNPGVSDKMGQLFQVSRLVCPPKLSFGPCFMSVGVDYDVLGNQYTHTRLHLSETPDEKSAPITSSLWMAEFRFKTSTKRTEKPIREVATTSRRDVGETPIARG
jgi:hypothetical protein